MSLFSRKEPFKNELERVQAYQAVFGSELGARVLSDMATRTGMFDLRLNLDPQVLAAGQGERNVVLRIVGILETSLERLKEIMKEDVKNDR